MTEHAHHSGRPIILAIIGLLVLTGASFLLAQLLSGTAGTALALAIAAAKASIVALIFMELRDAPVPMRVTALVTVSFILLLCAGTVADVALR
ncbi:MAG: hypothetical protein F9K40_19920 [Kofleriaceae bacterium]|nr:MAG: hypothetical protein F9K40_19920 [Kofleriaceae bacterium]MBZ0235932.1 cytochrome C oxidase subunit IV family protein [Kofleriaceae bacterium]